ncbi:MAG: M28 family peptidase [Cyclobacteriaceae bacterium]
MMRKGFQLFIVCVLFGFSSEAQKKVIKNIEKSVSQQGIESHMYFYASDELRGRNTGTIENRIAARYIAERFRAYGVKPVDQQNGFFQEVGLTRTKIPNEAQLTVGDSVFNLWDDMIFTSPATLEIDSANYVFIDYGTAADFEDKNFEGKIAVGIYALPPEGQRLERDEMVSLLKEKGAVALLELYRPTKFDWPLLINYLSNDSYELSTQEVEESNFPVGWIVDPNLERLKFFRESESLPVSLSIRGSKIDHLTVPNVVGYIEGTDPKLKDEYILISAHLDHVGVKNVVPGEDSIFNGARDNGIGITNMLTTAEYFGKNPPKRSLLFLACNAEEVGLLGSEWYAEHPLIPLRKTVYNINTDTGGYNDVTKITVVGLNRTNTAPELIKSGKPFGLTVIDDQVPEENLYERSDNVSFAKKGVPAISFDPGYTAMDDEIKKYYHQPGDEPQTIDYEYLSKYCKAYIYAVYLLTEMDTFKWTEGDKYQEAGKQLYE